ncbi:3-hydroxyacyl-ACP dehydratase FabZ family protein [Planctomycetes bacterium K23_9]|uniref:3-hydroxyacyl-[acyl-carrier-protein] dehydratase FabZ n=1 Tax=Stieleria marina TaxID=1930275 RepID=A0A517NNH7_9BACT|nr:3-hydroxyacyl-[acyl-carrier-protein] dehydratase FabZ [Planctomycetes bacterium K23_9]
MRWFWIDRFTEFVSGSHACGLKNIALDEECIDEYCPGYPMLPPTLIIEGMAQLGGIMVAEHFQFEKRVVLAKVGKAKFHQPPRTGDQLLYRVTMDAVQEDGATVTGVSHCDGKLQAEIDLMFAFLEPGRFTDGPLYKSGDLKSMLQMMRFFHVAVDLDGNPVPIYTNI